MAQVTVQQILHQGYTAYERSHKRPGYVRKAVWALLACRTAMLGGHVHGCPDGHVQRVWYNSCRHRLCPQCAWLQVERWLSRQQARLLACDHYHVILTLPDALRGLWLANITVMTPLLFAAVREPLCERLGDEQYLGAQPGIIAALHTWSQTLVCQPHLHCLVTGGGLTDEGQWRAVRHGFLLPARVVMAGFRGKLLAALRRGVAHGELRRPAGRSGQQLEKLLTKRGRQKWKVHIRERYAHGVGVLTSVARYLRGGPISKTRLVSCAHGEVTFRYRVNGEGADSQQRGLMPLPIAECIRRFLWHVPKPGTKVVRGYGRYAPTKWAALARCREQLGQGPVVRAAVLDWQTACRQRGEDHPERCPVCGRLLVCSGVIPRSSGPPAVAALGESVA
jgi:hypothetical protein